MVGHAAPCVSGYPEKSAIAAFPATNLAKSGFDTGRVEPKLPVESSRLPIATALQQAVERALQVFPIRRADVIAMVVRRQPSTIDIFPTLEKQLNKPPVSASANYLARTARKAFTLSAAANFLRSSKTGSEAALRSGSPD
jgi:hypothetical protein